MSNGTQPFYPNFDNCDKVTPLCPASATVYGDFFNLAGCIIFVVVHTLCLGWQIVQAVRGKTISFSIFLAIGTGFEIMGYGARISMTPIGTVWNYNAFVIQLLMLILAPTLVAAAISVTFKWIAIQQGIQYSLMKPKWYPWIFVGTDFFSIIIQAIGGGVSAAATNGQNNNQSLLDVGSGLLVAGVAFQAANMAFCGGLMVVYYWRYRKGLMANKSEIGPRKISWKPDTHFKKYIWAITVAYIAVLIRCIYRIPEMSMGWGSELMQDETLFLILDGAMVAIAVILLTIFHPAIYFPILRRDNRKAMLPAPASPDSEQPSELGQTNVEPKPAPTA